MENITYRKKKLQRRSLSMSSLHSNTKSLSEQSLDSFIDAENNKSLPTLDNLNTSLLEELKSKLHCLEIELECAHKEILNLNCEITSLRRENHKQSKLINTLKKITVQGTPSKTSTPQLKQTTLLLTPQKSSPTTSKTNNIMKRTVYLNENQTNNCNIEKDGRKKITSNCKEEMSNIINCESSGIDGVTGKPTASKMTSYNEKTNLTIIGDQQVRNLSLSFIKYKSNCVNAVSSFIKPNASSTEILKHKHELLQFSKKDTVIISVGANDYKPYSLFSTLCNTLNNLQNCNQVFVISVRQNACLNTNLLNFNLKQLCEQYKNCTFIDLNYYFKNYSVRNAYSNIYDYLVFKINMEIEHNIYVRRFLSYNKNTCKNMNKTNLTFNLIKTNDKITYQEYKNNIENIVKQRQFKKGTIPYMFNIIQDKKQNITLKNKQNSSQASFFREYDEIQASSPKHCGDFK